MAKKLAMKPRILLTRPPWWLDEREEETRRWLMQHFAMPITALENTVDVLSFAVEDIEQPMQPVPLKISDLESLGNEAELRQFVAVGSLVEALDSLHAARRLLLCGYFSKMLAAVRAMVEALRTADICRNDAVRAREWIHDKEIKKPSEGELHPTIKQMMRNYDFLSKAGSHHLLASALTSSLGKPYHERFQKANGSQTTADLEDAIGSLIEYLNKSAALFLLYLNNAFSVNWDKDLEVKRKVGAYLAQRGLAGRVSTLDLQSTPSVTS